MYGGAYSSPFVNIHESLSSVFGENLTKTRSQDQIHHMFTFFRIALMRTKI